MTKNVYIGFLLMWVFVSHSIAGISYMSAFCGQAVNLGELKLTEMEIEYSSLNKYPPNLNCRMKFVAAGGSRLMFNFIHVNFDSCGDRIGLYGATVPGDPISTEMCENPKEVFVSSGETGTLWFQSGVSGGSGGFSVLITVFRPAVNKTCGSGAFKCSNSRCIESSLECNKRDNCGDGSDEKSCGEGIQPWMIVVGCFLVLVILVWIRCVSSKKNKTGPIPKDKKSLQHAQVYASDVITRPYELTADDAHSSVKATSTDHNPPDESTRIQPFLSKYDLESGFCGPHANTNNWVVEPFQTDNIGTQSDRKSKIRRRVSLLELAVRFGRVDAASSVTNDAESSMTQESSDWTSGMQAGGQANLSEETVAHAWSEQSQASVELPLDELRAVASPLPTAPPSYHSLYPGEDNLTQPSSIS